MGKITLVGEVSPGDGVDQLRDFLANLSNDVVQQVNGNLTFGDNIKCNILSINFTVANTDQTVSHSLRKTPVGYFLISTDNPTSLYTGSREADSSTITLQSNAVANTKVLVF